MERKRPLLSERESESETGSCTAGPQDDPGNAQFIGNTDRKVHNRVMNNEQDRIPGMHRKQKITKLGGRIPLVKGRYEGNKITIRGTLDVGEVA